MKKHFKILILIGFALGLLCLCSCQTKDKTHSFMDTSKIDNAEFEYDSITDETTVTWRSELTNETIYDFTSFKVTFELFEYGVSLGEKTYRYDVGVKQGQEYSGSFEFVAKGRVTDIEFVKWVPAYSSIWQTYTALLIISIIFVIIAGVSYGFIILYNDIDLDFMYFDNFFDEGGTIWSIIFLGAPAFFLVRYFFSPNWVFALVFFLAIVAIFVLMGVVHFIHFLYNFIDFSGFQGSTSRYYYEEPRVNNVEKTTSSKPASEETGTCSSDDSTSIR